jgi:hypothetical protein
VTLSIVDFLREQLAKDEAVARKATAVSSHRWMANNSLLMFLDDSPTPFAESLACTENYRQDDVWEHAERHDPARALREVEAKRAIMELADEASGLDMSVDIDRAVRPRDTTTDPYVGDMIIRQLAAVYSDHPDYQEEWRP